MKEEGMDDSSVLEAYKLYRAETHKSIELHATHLKNFLAILIAVSGATLAGAQYYINWPFQFGLVLITGGCLGIASAYLGKGMCDRFYEGMLEGVAMSAKLEEVLGLESRPKPKDTNSVFHTFPADSSIIPMRWLNNRHKFKSSEEFIRAHMDLGSNKVSRLVFRIFLYVYMGVLAAGVLAVVFACKVK